MAANRLKVRTITGAIFNRLRAEILDGKFLPGAPLKQDLLANSFGVSRIPVREALLQLEAEGLVRIVPHKGAIVTSISRDEIEDVFDLRMLLEPRLLERSAPLLDDDDFDLLGRIQSEFVLAVERGDTARWGALNADLHMALYAKATTPRTMSIVAGLLHTSERYTRIQLSSRVAWERARAEHADLVHLCREGETEAACDLLRRHIDTVRHDLAGLVEAPVAPLGHSLETEAGTARS